ncbi:Ig-like domain-containing protein [Clostridium sp.]|uniref:Ig-like domain-containing protein n=1 Tax=Clostridium sp. TaxID=1506 RepID=UPI0035A0B4B1
MVKILKNFLIFASIIAMYQLNPYNLVRAENVSTVSEVQTASTENTSDTQDLKDTDSSSESKSSTFKDAAYSYEKDVNEDSISQNPSDSTAAEDDFVISTSNVDNYKNISANKIWKIKFNQPIILSSAEKSIKILDKKTNKEVPINISSSEDNFCVDISNTSSYAPDSDYLLIIDAGLMSAYNKTLKTSFSMTFSTGSIITSINDISVSINQRDSYKLPDVVTANMSNGEKKSVSVTWDKSLGNLNIPGSYVYQGQVEGYDKKVNLNLIINTSAETVPSSVTSTSAWIWQLQNQVDAYGGIDNLISKLKSLGINNVCIKYNEGERASGGGMNFREDFLKYVNNFKEAGFKVGTWGYNHFDDVQGEANIIVDAINNSDYYVFDPEDAVSGKTNQAEEICQIVRSECPDAIIGYTTFPIASYHQDIPYSVFNKYCDFAAPQCYWGEMRWSVTKCMDKMIQDYQYYGLDKPLYPLIQTYNVDYADYETYAGYKFNSTGLWSFDELGSTCQDFLINEGDKLNNQT